MHQHKFKCPQKFDWSNNLKYITILMRYLLSLGPDILCTKEELKIKFKYSYVREYYNGVQQQSVGYDKKRNGY